MPIVQAVWFAREICAGSQIVHPNLTVPVIVQLQLTLPSPNHVTIPVQQMLTVNQIWFVQAACVEIHPVHPELIVVVLRQRQRQH